MKTCGKCGAKLLQHPKHTDYLLCKKCQLIGTKDAKISEYCRLEEKLEKLKIGLNTVYIPGHLDIEQVDHVINKMIDLGCVILRFVDNGMGAIIAVPDCLKNDEHIKILTEYL